MIATTATPAEIDTKLAELYGARGQAYDYVDNALKSIHTKVGDRPGRHGYGYSHEQARTLAQEALDNGTLRSFDHDVLTRAFATLAEQEAIIAALDTEIAPLDAEYDRRPWSRFIAVPGGHLHSGRRCVGGTIRVTTKVVWNPGLSGKTEAEAVKQLGTILCTHCFPSAPVEWTVGVKPKREHCAGSGKSEVPGTVKRVRASVYGRCQECGVVKPLTQHGFLRAHPPVKA